MVDEASVEDDASIDGDDSGTVELTAEDVRTDVEMAAGEMEVGDTATVMALAAICETAWTVRPTPPWALPERAAVWGSGEVSSSRVCEKEAGRTSSGK